MTPHRACIRALLLVSSVLAAAPALTAEVTPERLVNADKEPGNWLMNHRTYDAQRFSPLEKINKANVKGLKLAYAVALGGAAADENLEATPLAEDGLLYMTDQWSVLYKIDARSGDMGRIIWRMDPAQQMLGAANRGAALWGNFVITMANYPPRMIATDKGTGKVVWETNLSDGQPRVTFSGRAFGRQGQDHHRRLRRRQRHTRFHRRGGCRNRQTRLAQIRDSGPRRTRQRDLEG